MLLPTQSGCYVLDSLIQDQKVQLKCIAQNVAGVDSISINVIIPKEEIGKKWHSWCSLFILKFTTIMIILDRNIYLIFLVSKPITTLATSQNIQTNEPDDNSIVDIILPLGII